MPTSDIPHKKVLDVWFRGNQEYPLLTAIRQKQQANAREHHGDA